LILSGVFRLVCSILSTVMAGLVPAFHVLGLHVLSKDVDAIGERSDAVPGTAMHKPGHDKSLSHQSSKRHEVCVSANLIASHQK
jgi:hypothetical protein